MNMRKLILIIILLLIIPTAKAEDRVINVLDNQHYTQSFPQQAATSIYQFSLNSLFFNISALGINESVWKADIRVQILEDGYISQSNRYNIRFNYNSTYSINYDVEYTKQAFGYWHRAYHFQLLNNGQIISQCDTNPTLFNGLHNFGGSTLPPPNPWIRFNYELHGRFGTAPSLYIQFGDDSKGDRTCNLPDSIGGGIQIIMPELTTPPSVSISTFDSELYTHQIQYQFDTKLHEELAQEQFNIENGQGCEQTFIIFGLCNLVNGLEAGINFIFDGIEFVMAKILGRIPLVGIIFQSIAMAISTAGDFITDFLNIFFVTNDKFGLGQVFWFHVIYSAAWGCLIAAITGNLLHIILTPAWFVYYTFKGLYYLFKFFFWTLPNAAADFIKSLIPG